MLAAAVLLLLMAAAVLLMMLLRWAGIAAAAEPLLMQWSRRPSLESPLAFVVHRAFEGAL